MALFEMGGGNAKGVRLSLGGERRALGSEIRGEAKGCWEKKQKAVAIWHKFLEADKDYTFKFPLRPFFYFIYIYIHEFIESKYYY